MARSEEGFEGHLLSLEGVSLHPKGLVKGFLPSSMVDLSEIKAAKQSVPRLPALWMTFCATD